MPSLSWRLTSKTNDRNDVVAIAADDTLFTTSLPTAAILLAVSAILIGGILMCVLQLFPLECLSPGDGQKEKPPIVLVKYTTKLAFIIPALSTLLLKLNHVIAAVCSTNRIAELSDVIISHVALFTYFACYVIGACGALGIIGSLKLRPMLYVLGLCQIFASVSFLIGHNLAIVLMCAAVSMAVGTSSIMPQAILLACAYHSRIHIIVATLVFAKDGLSELAYVTLREFVIWPEITGSDTWIFVCTLLSVVFTAVVYLGNLTMEFITRKDVDELNT